MYGKCQWCEEYTSELDVWFNENEEVCACPKCGPKLNSEEDSEDDIARTENAVLDAQERSASRRGVGGY